MSRKVEKNNYLDLYYYELLLLTSNNLKKLFNSLIDKYSPKEGRISNLICNVIEKQLKYLDREGIYYCRNIFFGILIFLSCVLSKQILILYFIVNLYKLFCIPKKAYHKLSYNYIYNAILSLPLILLTSMFSSGLQGFVISMVTSLYLLTRCNPREFENKYAYNN